jgi:hypothetical protein
MNSVLNAQLFLFLISVTPAYNKNDFTWLIYRFS